MLPSACTGSANDNVATAAMICRLMVSSDSRRAAAKRGMLCRPAFGCGKHTPAGAHRERKTASPPRREAVSRGSHLDQRYKLLTAPHVAGSIDTTHCPGDDEHGSL